MSEFTYRARTDGNPIKVTKASEYENFSSQDAVVIHSILILLYQLDVYLIAPAIRSGPVPRARPNR
jgi:hypothetical protein